jgi:regulator of sirC expression with transglutaminase-like and TPR domain
VATRLGLNVSGVGLPGHYIVKVQFDLNEVYVDPFHDGQTLTIADVGELLSRVTGRQVRLSSEHLRAWTARETLVRVLANLQNMWTGAGEPRRAASAAERMVILQG